MKKTTYTAPRIKTLVIDGDAVMQATSIKSEFRGNHTEAYKFNVDMTRDDGSTEAGAKGSSGDGLWD